MRFGIAAAALAFQQAIPTTVAYQEKGNSESNKVMQQAYSSLAATTSIHDDDDDERKMFLSSHPMGQSIQVEASKDHHRHHHHQRRRRNGKDRNTRGLLDKSKTKRLERESSSTSSTLVNNRMETDDNENNSIVECDPKSVDMGILACGARSYCVESQFSSTGGICSSSPTSRSRHLQQPPPQQSQSCSDDDQCSEGQFCNVNIGFDDGLVTGVCVDCPCGNYPILTCDWVVEPLSNRAAIQSCIDSCTQAESDPLRCEPFTEYYYCEPTIDPDTGFEGQSCKGISLNCFDSVGSCCYTFSFESTYDVDDYRALEATYYFVAPYHQNITLSYNNVDVECYVAFDEEVCNGCSTSSNYNYSGEVCVEFDCTNNPPGGAGNLCDYTSGNGIYDLIPILGQCSSYNPNPDPYPPPPDNIMCNICGFTAYPDNPDEELSGGYSCQDVWRYSYTNVFDGTETCETATKYFSSICCIGVAPCNICDDRPLTNPNEFVDIPTLGVSAYCYVIYYTGLEGGIVGDESCAIVSGIAGPICCLTKEEDNVGSIAYCPICPDGQSVSSPDLLISTPGLPNMTCTQLQAFGKQGLIPPELCETTQITAPALCGCGIDEPQTTPVASKPPVAPPGSSSSSSSSVPSMVPGDNNLSVSPEADLGPEDISNDSNSTDATNETETPMSAPTPLPSDTNGSSSEDESGSRSIFNGSFLGGIPLMVAACYMLAF